MSHPHRLLLKWARYVHVYLTMFGLLVILFFAATGFILNHPDWFGQDDKHDTTVTGSVPTNLAREPDKLALVELLRKDFGATGYVEPFDTDDPEELEVRFKSPGRETIAKIKREDGSAKITHSSFGLLGLLTDLHRGDASPRHSGETWSLVIDGVAILLLLVSVTGLILWTSLRSRGQFGIAAMTMGLAVCVAIYFLYVP